VAQFIFFTGTLFGVLVSGYLSDKFGRMATYVGWLTLWVVAGLLEAIVSSFWLWTALRFLVGGASIAYNTVQTVYLIEITGQRWRSVTNNYFRAVPFLLGYISLALLVYLLPNMVHTELFIAGSGIPFLFVMLFLPESPRWLLVNGKLKEGDPTDSGCSSPQTLFSQASAYAGKRVASTAFPSARGRKRG